MFNAIVNIDIFPAGYCSSHSGPYRIPEMFQRTSTVKGHLQIRLLRDWQSLSSHLNVC